MTADHLAVDRFDVSRLGRQVLLEEIAESPFANEADAGGILLLCRGQAMLLRNRADLGLLQLADGKQRLGQLLASDGMQEVALVLVGVEALEQFAAAIAVATPHVMASGDEVGTEHQGVIEERLELDFPVAEDVRVRRAPGLVFGEEVLEHVVPVLGSKVGGVQLDADAVTHGLGIGQVFLGGAVLRAVVLFPVLHEQAFDLIALFEQQESGNGRVDAAGHANDNAGVFRGGEGRNRHRSTPGFCKGANSIS